MQGFQTNTGVQPAKVEQTTRAYGPGFRLECTGTANTRPLSSGANNMGLAIGDTRELRIASNVRCWVRESSNAAAAAVPSANSVAASMVFEANMPEVVQLAPDTTHLSVIKDTGAADGYVAIRPVA